MSHPVETNKRPSHTTTTTPTKHQPTLLSPAKIVYIACSVFRHTNTTQEKKIINMEYICTYTYPLNMRHCRPPLHGCRQASGEPPCVRCPMRVLEKKNYKLLICISLCCVYVYVMHAYSNLNKTRHEKHDAQKLKCIWCGDFSCASFLHRDIIRVACTACIQCHRKNVHTDCLIWVYNTQKKHPTCNNIMTNSA